MNNAGSIFRLVPLRAVCMDVLTEFNDGRQKYFRVDTLSNVCIFKHVGGFAMPHADNDNHEGKRRA